MDNIKQLIWLTKQERKFSDCVMSDSCLLLEWFISLCHFWFCMWM